MQVIDPDHSDNTKDAKLMAIARKREGFKSHLLSYCLVNSFLWSIWYFTARWGYPWPIWPTLGWGIGLAFNYFAAYHNDDIFSVDKEYEKLKGGGK